MLVDGNGRTLRLLDTIRTAAVAALGDMPVVVLSSEHDALHRVRMLERGGDDIIAKPFSYPELLARVRAVLRRTRPRQPHPIIQAGPVRIDLRRRAASIDSRPVKLSALEYELLRKLASEPTRVFSRHELMRDIWGYSGARSRTLDSHACRLRAKLATDTQALIINVWGVGYRLIDPRR